MYDEEVRPKKRSPHRPGWVSLGQSMNGIGPGHIYLVGGGLIHGGRIVMTDDDGHVIHEWEVVQKF